LVFKIDLGPYSPRWNNTIFHSTQEAVYIWPNSPDVSRNYSPIKTNIILTGSALSSAGITGPYTSLGRVMSGNYIIPGDISSQFYNRFYISDYLSGTILTTLQDGLRKWSSAAIADFIENKYYLSGSSKFIELGGYNKMLPVANLASGIGYLGNYIGYLWDGGYAAADGFSSPAKSYHGVCVPSSSMLNDLYRYSGVGVDLRILLKDSSGSTITDFTFTISNENNPGNSPDGYLITALDSLYNNRSGLASLINDSISSEPGGLSNNIIFENVSTLSPYYDGGGDGIYTQGSRYFGGLKMSIKNPKTSSTYLNKYIHSMEIMWGEEMNAFINNIRGKDQFPLSSFASDVKSTGADMASWTGLPSTITIPASSYANYFRGWKIGGSL
jgi:hypothetical protein